MASLCDHCRKLPFSELSCPTASDILKAQHAARNNIQASKRLPFSDTERCSDFIYWSETPLGSLSRIRKDKEHCGLCGLLYHVFQQWGGPRGMDNIQIENHDYINCFAIIIPYTCVTESIGDKVNSPNVYFYLQRLGLSTRTGDEGSYEAVYNNVAQACNIDEFEQLNFSPQARADDQRMLFGGRKRPETINLNLLQSWITICENAHGMTCRLDENPSGSDQLHSCDSNPSETPVRFIDVRRNNITEHKLVNLNQTTYAALSYTWGDAQQVTLERDNEASLQIENALEHVRLPQTIKDAIFVARELGIDYLWVDALCVRQGQHESDKKDRTYQLRNMGTIYRRAFLTIIAASGEDADAGLSGIRPGSRQKQRVVEVIPRDKDNNLGMALVTTCDNPTVYNDAGYYQDNEIDRSYWNSRGWTFQERALSRRCLIFAKGQVYWVCDGAVFCEESQYEHPEVYEKADSATPLRIELDTNPQSPLSWKTIDGPLARANFDQQTVWEIFDNAVATFSKRNLGRQGDVHDAFQGVAEAFERMYGESFHWGHPRSRFELSLSWDHYDDIHHRTENMTGEMTSLNQQVILPSWSWMGWFGSPLLEISDHWLKSRTPEIRCYEHQGQPLRFRPVHGTDEVDAEDRAGVEESAGPNRQSCSLSSTLTALTCRAWSALSPFASFTYSSICSCFLPSSVEDLATSKQCSLWRGDRARVTWVDVDRECPGLKASKLQGIPDGHILFFWASSASFVVEPASSRVLIRNTKGQIVGLCCSRPSRAASGPQEFVVIGREEATHPDCPPGVLALQICWEDGIAYRVNIAEIEEPAWIEANPVWKLIALM